MATVISIKKHEAILKVREDEILRLIGELSQERIDSATLRQEQRDLKRQYEEAETAVKALDEALTEKSGAVKVLRHQLEISRKEASAAREYIQCLTR